MRGLNIRSLWYCRYPMWFFVRTLTVFQFYDGFFQNDKKQHGYSLCLTLLTLLLLIYFSSTKTLIIVLILWLSYILVFRVALLDSSGFCDACFSELRRVVLKISFNILYYILINIKKNIFSSKAFWFVCLLHDFASIRIVDLLLIHIELDNLRTALVSFLKKLIAALAIIYLISLVQLSFNIIWLMLHLTSLPVVLYWFLDIFQGLYTHLLLWFSYTSTQLFIYFYQRQLCLCVLVLLLNYLIRRWYIYLMNFNNKFVTNALCKVDGFLKENFDLTSLKVLWAIVFFFCVVL